MKNPGTVLIVEDEKNLGKTLQEYLQSIGINNHLAQNATEAKKFFYDSSIQPSVVLMDINLPDGNGLELAKEFRSIRKNFSLLFLSALSDPEIRVEGLEVGGDDYITKPFKLKELTLRLQRILESKNHLDTLPDCIEEGKLKIWFSRYQVQDSKGKIIDLSQKECAILRLLYSKKNQVVARDEMIEQVWGQESFPSNRTIDNYIVSLRKWCESTQDSGAKILSVRGVGYKFLTTKTEGEYNEHI